MVEREVLRYHDAGRGPRGSAPTTINTGIGPHAPLPIALVWSDRSVRSNAAFATLSTTRDSVGCEEGKGARCADLDRRCYTVKRRGIV